MSPLYDFVCSNGHRDERLTPALTDAVECSECGNEAGRVVPSPFSRPPRQQGWGSDFEWTPSLWQMHEDATGYRRDAETIAREYKENGFRMDGGRSARNATKGSVR